MFIYRVSEHKDFNPGRHSENILGRYGTGDVSIACHEPNQTGPNHAHPGCTEIYFCVEGGGSMRVGDEKVVVSPGVIAVHPPGELHEFSSGSERTVLFRIRYGEDFTSRIKEWPSNPDWKPEGD